MKTIVKILSVALVAVIFSTNLVNAQVLNKEAFEKSLKRSEKLVKLIEKKPTESGATNIDGFVKSVGVLALKSTELTEELQNFYKRSIGETKDGVTDVTVKKPTLEECFDLLETIKTQADAIAGISKTAESIANEVKSLDKKLALKVVKPIKFTKDAISLLVEESGFQVKAINEMIETLKTSDNL